MIFVDSGPPRAFISERVPVDVLALLQSETPRVIAALEVLPVYLARVTWAEHLLHRRTFVFIDNDAARHSLITGSSSAPSVERALRAIVMHQAKVPSFMWYSRVPSASNIADLPSRFDCQELMRAGAEQTRVGDDLWRAAIS